MTGIWWQCWGVGGGALALGHHWDGGGCATAGLFQGNYCWVVGVGTLVGLWHCHFVGAGMLVSEGRDLIINLRGGRRGEGGG